MGVKDLFCGIDAGVISIRDNIFLFLFCFVFSYSIKPVFSHYMIVVKR